MATTPQVQTELQKDKFEPQSRYIALVEYDPNANTMDVSFHSGSKIRYLLVYPGMYRAFKESPTHDAYFSRGIRGRHMSVKLVDRSIGRTQSAPLKKMQREGKLDRGIKSDRVRTERYGTVAAASL